MSSARTRRSEPCAFEDCGSRRFYIGDDGYTYCDQGHQQSARGTVIAEDTGELVIHGQKSRRKDSDVESRTSRASSFSGADAFEHYLLCLQLVLRRQLRWLIDIQKLPEELEALTKDLWSLRLQKIHGKVSYDSETDTEAFSSQAFSSQSESGSASASRSSRRSQRTAKVNEGTPGLIDLLSLCYIAMLLLRVPVTVADLHEWINRGDLPYYRVAREIPMGMRQRLPAQYQGILEPQELLQPEALHQKVLSTAMMLNNDFGMALAPLNVQLLLYRWVRDLVLPLEIFAGTQRLAKLVGADFFSLVASKANKAVVLRYPEAQLMALIVIATKLLFPLDVIERRPYEPPALSSMALDWDAWIKLHKSGEHDDAQLTFDQAFDLKESKGLLASDEKLDAYLDWYEDNIANEEIREHGRARQDAEFRRALFQMFPTPSRKPANGREQSSIDSESAYDRLCKSPETLQRERVAQCAPSRNVNRLGSFYRRFRTVEELSGPVKLLFEKAAVLAALSLESMVQAVFLTEKRLEKFEDRLRRGATESGPG